MKAIIEALKPRGRFRLDRDIELLVPLVQSIKFIQDIFKEKEAKFHTFREIANCLAYETHAKDTNVFDYGKHQP